MQASAGTYLLQGCALLCRCRYPLVRPLGHAACLSSVPVFRLLLHRAPVDMVDIAFACRHVHIVVLVTSLSSAPMMGAPTQTKSPLQLLKEIFSLVRDNHAPHIAPDRICLTQQNRNTSAENYAPQLRATGIPAIRCRGNSPCCAVFGILCGSVFRGFVNGGTNSFAITDVFCGDCMA